MFRELLAGVGLLGRGFGLLGRRPKLFWLGAVPPLFTSMVFTGLLVLLITELKPIVGWLTGAPSPVSGGPVPTGTSLVQVLVGFALVAGAIVAMVLTFATLTLAIGSPIYDRISVVVDRELGPVPPEREEPAAVGAARALRQSLGLVFAGLATAVVFALLALIPVVGQIGAAVGSACVGGWLLCLELTGSPLERRGVLTVAERRTRLRRHRWRTLGLGIPTFLLMSIPFVAVLVFPAATAAGTILAREISEETTA